MSQALTVVQDLYLAHLQEIYVRCPEKMMRRIKRCVNPHATEVAEAFYETIRDIGDVANYLSTDEVVARLIPSMSNWIRELFILRNREETLAYIETQLNIGHLHARIKLPPNLFNCGVRVLKREIKNHLIHEAKSIEDFRDMAQIVDMLADVTSSLMNEGYFVDLVRVEHQSQSLQLQVMGQSLALKCEKLRADTFSWQNRTLNELLKSDHQLHNKLPLASRSEIGMWVNHKASLYFKDSQEILKMRQNLLTMDTLVEQIVDACRNKKSDESNHAIDLLNDVVLDFTSILSTLSEMSLGMEGARDTLTKLLNRRYLDTVMQQETNYSISNKSPYIVMLMDIDNFKAVNDEHGHQAGDEVLSQVAEILNRSVRAGDFLFRYGGEEFLLLLPEMGLASAESLAQNLCKSIAENEVEINSQKTLLVTISIGVAMHDFSSDYKRVLNQADTAMYAAKSAGRNGYKISA